jgi:hypothetical protein
MPKLIPPYLSKASPFCETIVHNIFKYSDTLDDYIIFHSLNIAHHKNKREGEADFVILGPSGILVLEVKGADKIVRNEGQWTYYTNQKKYNSYESPFNQAKNNLYSLINHINNDLGINLKNNSGYGVVFPRLIFNEKSPEWDNNIVYDEKCKLSFHVYIANLYDYWKKRSRIQNQPTLSKYTISVIAQYLRGNFEIVESAVSFSSKVNKLIDQLTEEQYKFLDMVVDNPRILVKGYAGTGKTMLAIEQAKRASNKYNNVLFLCYNRLLSYNIQAQLNKHVNNVKISTFDSFLYDLFVKYIGHPTEIDFSSVRNIIKTIKANKNRKAQLYDYMIVDEAQDIFGDEFIDMINYSIFGGTDDGRWSIFYDDEVQSSLYNLNSSKLCYKTISQHSIRLSLNANCRNPRMMLEELNRITKLPISEELRIDIQDDCIDYQFFNSDREQEYIIANKILSYLKQGFIASQITLLFINQDVTIVNNIYMLLQQRIRSILDLRKYYSSKDDDPDIYLDKRDIGYSTVQAYKGLENDIIILCDVNTLFSVYDKALLYVGITRAKLYCTVICDSKIKNMIIN